MSAPSDRKYLKTHEWAQRLPDGTVLVGITDHAQSSLGDITFVQLPTVGASLAAATGFGVVESVKAASDLYTPIGGTVVEINDSLNSSPDLVNREPYTGGWMIKLKPSSPSEYDGLLSAEAYDKLLG
jgi:glycine cleavage system H protein